MTEPAEPAEPVPPAAEPAAETAEYAAEPAEPAGPADGVAAPGPRVRLRALPALAIASILVAAGLLMAIGGMVRLVGPAPYTPTPTIAASAAATPFRVTPLP